MLLLSENSCFSLVLAILCVFIRQYAQGTSIAKFEISSVDTRSIVVRMLDAPNVTRFDMEVVIFDLDHLREFRRSSLSTSRYQDQLFSFDGLTAGTWFAIRIEYRLVYKSPNDHREFNTKQEFIVCTKSEDEETDLSNRSNLASLSMNNGLLSHPADGLIQLEGIVTDAHHINITVFSVFPTRTKVTTLVVPELFCEQGFIKPPAQRLYHRTHIHFDLKKLHEVQRNPNKPLNCNRLCIYPFIRAPIGPDIQSFRGKEWCGSLQQAYEVVGTANAMWLPNTGIFPTISKSLVFASLLFLLFRLD